VYRPSSEVPDSRPGDAGSSATAVFGAFMRAMHTHRQLMARKLSARGISPAQMFCLREVAHHPGLTQRDLAEKLSVSRPTLTVMLHKMEKSGLIERRADEADQRFTRIYVAQDGARVHEDMHEVVGEVIAEMVGPLSEPDRLELARLLTALGDNMTTALETPEKADR
jgi:DNA-binding MarR family transcriptional regulator